MTLALGGAFAFIASAPSAFAQNANPGPANGLTAPNNDAGSGGSHAPGSKISGPHEPANPIPGNGSANESTTALPTADNANPEASSNSTGPVTAKPGHPERPGPAGSKNIPPGQ
jgi:hypothetical protein